MLRSGGKGKKLKIVLRTRDNLSLHVVTIGIVKDIYDMERFEIIR